MLDATSITKTRKPNLVILSGAGLSADSGIQTFRGSDGLWEGHDVMKVANGLTWKQNWDLVRQFYNARRANIGTAEPNAMHRLIADWEQRYDIVNLTQNIDDLLERGGCKTVHHLHGELTKMRCDACGNVWDIGYNAVSDTDRCNGKNGTCNSLKGVRPKVVFFHEPAPLYSLMYHAIKNLTAQDCLVVIGTSGLVIDVNSLVFDCKALKILNNLESSEHINEDYFDHVFLGKASEQAVAIDTVVTNYMSN